MADKRIKCCCCQRSVPANPRVKDQKYCGRPECVKERKRRWRQGKLSTDPAFGPERRDSQRRWMKANPKYWRRWRRKHPEYMERNRHLQRTRDGRRRVCKVSACKVDSFQPRREAEAVSSVLAKCDSLGLRVQRIEGLMGLAP
jgi:hypothetical protein